MRLSVLGTIPGAVSRVSFILSWSLRPVYSFPAPSGEPAQGPANSPADSSRSSSPQLRRKESAPSAGVAIESALMSVPTGVTLDDVVGTWRSEAKQTTRGLMRFVFRIGDGRLEIVGNSTDTPGGEEYYRSGEYRLDGDQLISPVINQGQPAELALRNGWLSLTIDETLTLRLRRDLREE